MYVYRKHNIVQIPYTKIVLILSLFLTYCVSKILFLAVLFIVLDYLNTLLKTMVRINLPVDFVITGSIIFGYLFGWKYSVFLVVFNPINRLLLGVIENKHLLKLVPTIIASIAADFFSGAGFVASVSLCLGLMYLIDYALEFILFQRFKLRITTIETLAFAYIFLSFFQLVIQV